MRTAPLAGAARGCACRLRAGPPGHERVRGIARRLVCPRHAGIRAPYCRTSLRASVFAVDALSYAAPDGRLEPRYRAGHERDWLPAEFHGVQHFADLARNLHGHGNPVVAL